jgi:protein tyrosine phosphatase
MKIKDEYNNIVRQSSIPQTWKDKLKYCSLGVTPFSYGENRYKDIIAKSTTQVLLADYNKDYNYINANNIWVKFSSHISRHFIISQAPLLSTLIKHWSMIWQYSIPVTVMITNLTEKNKKKADIYWPNLNSSTQYGNIVVKCYDHSVISNGLHIRKFKLTSNGQIKYHYHLQYIKWNDLSIPPNISEIHNLILQTYNYSSELKLSSPILIHCSAGVGRSGTFLSCYCLFLQKQINLTSSLNISDLVLHLRTQRFGLVQTLSQYQFIYSYRHYLSTK